MKSHAGEMVSYSNIKLHYELYVLFCHAKLSIRKEGGHFVCYIALLCFVGRTKWKVKTQMKEITDQLSYISYYSTPSPIWIWLVSRYQSP